MNSVWVSLRGFLSVTLLPSSASFDSLFTIYHIFPEIDSEIAKVRPEMQLEAFDLHMNNVGTCNFRQTRDKLDRFGIKRISHSAYLLAISLGDFRLYDFFTPQLKGTQSTNDQNLLDAILAVLPCIKNGSND
jgi:hypothetical protein